jgi:phage major head subunit gpT-like protein
LPQRVVTQALLDALRVDFDARFKDGRTKSKPVGALMSTTVSSSTKITTYGFLGELPTFRKWVGEKRIKSVEEKAYQLVNDPYEATVAIHKHQIEDDNLGLYPAMFEGWGMEAELWPDRLRFDALAQGHLRPCFDNQYFFDSDHPNYDDAGTTYSNINTAGTVQPWYLLDCSKPIKPLIFQEREKPHFWWVNDLKDSHVARTGEFTAFAEARGACGYTMPFLAYRSTATLNAANYVAARDIMAAYKDDVGDPRGIRPTHIVYGVSNRAAAEALFLKQLSGGGDSNEHYKAVELVYADRLP